MAYRKGYGKKFRAKRNVRRGQWSGGGRKTKTGAAVVSFKGPRAASQSIGGAFGFGSVRSPFPPTLWTVMSYSETFTLAQAATTVPIARTYRANGLFDPREAVGGIQPRYYDSLLGPDDGTAPYRRYRVHGCKISATVWPINGNANQSNCLITLLPRRSVVTSPSTIDEQRERPYGRHLAMTSTASYKPRKVKNFIKMKTLLGHKDLMDVDATAASHDGLPAEQIYWDVLLCDVQGTNTASATIQVNLQYYVQLYTLGDVADS